MLILNSPCILVGRLRETALHAIPHDHEHEVLNVPKDDLLRGRMRQLSVQTGESSHDADQRAPAATYNTPPRHTLPGHLGTAAFAGSSTLRALFAKLY